MDAVEFLTERKRMCDSHQPSCKYCELRKERCGVTPETKDEAQKVVAIVEKWSKDHPKKTRTSEFLKVYPNVSINTEDNLPIFYPCDMDCTFRGGLRCTEGCAKCREEYWTEEVK